MNKSFSPSDQLYFAQKLSLLLQSGISMVEALTMMRSIEISTKRKKTYDILIKSIQQGVSLSKSIRSSRISFNSLLVTLIQNGESSGHLSEALQQAYAYLEKRNEMKKQLSAKTAQERQSKNPGNLL